MGSKGVRGKHGDKRQGDGDLGFYSGEPEHHLQVCVVRAERTPCGDLEKRRVQVSQKSIMANF